ncbi:MAG: hypothetical protein DMG96_20185 [Acidobacteria bacterium]|nr:MAG: hypothetical protein DMG98_04190 [Acidobacteriota bacterium]PYV74450.1 MAG: hypothetical protein DMG96_20185 [Acidobacteriota bacterium]
MLMWSDVVKFPRADLLIPLYSGGFRSSMRYLGARGNGINRKSKNSTIRMWLSFRTQLSAENEIGTTAFRGSD